MPIELRQREIGADALTRFERQVLDLWDQGVGSRGIAAKLGVRHARVQSVISYFASNNETEASFRAATTASSQRLLSALQALSGSHA